MGIGVWQATIVNPAGDVVPSAQLEVTIESTAALAALWADLGATIPLANPVTADANGFVRVYLADSTTYKFRAFATGFERIWRDVPIMTPQAAVTAEAIGDLLNPESLAETAAGVDPLNTLFSEEYLQVKRFAPPGTPFTGSQSNRAAHTAASKAALLVANEYEGCRVVWGHGGWCINEPIVPDSDGLELIGDGAFMIAGTDLPDGGAIFHSMAGGGDATENQGILDGIYGPGVVSVRTNKANSLQDVRVRGFRFIAGPNDNKAMWWVGLTRGCGLYEMSFTNFTDHDVVVNGSWSCSMRDLRGKGSGELGVGLGIGKVGYGKRGNGVACNAFKVTGCHFGQHATGIEYDFGSCTNFDTTTLEGNAGDGFRSQSARALTLNTVYFENNAGHNCRLGGTNGTDFVDGLFMTACQLGALSGQDPTRRNISLQSVRNAWFLANINVYDEEDDPDYVSQMYFIPTGGGARVYKNVITVRAVNGTYISNSTELDRTKNIILLNDGTDFGMETANLRHMGPLLGLYGAAAVAKQTVSGSRGANAALADLLTEGAEVGAWTDSTTV